MAFLDLFWSLENSNPSKNNHFMPVWSLIQTYLFFDPIVSQCGLQMHKLLSNLSVCYLWTSVAVTSVFGKLRLAHPDRINHLWTLSFCASFAGTARTVNNWTYSLVDSVYPPKKIFLWLLGQFWGSLAIKEDMFGLFGFLDTGQIGPKTTIWHQFEV